MPWLAENWIGLFSLFFAALTFWMTFIRKVDPNNLPTQQNIKEMEPLETPDRIEFNHTMKVWIVYAANTFQVFIAVVFFFAATSTAEDAEDSSRVGYAFFVIFCSVILYKRLSLWLKYNRKKYN